MPIFIIFFLAFFASASFSDTGNESQVVHDLVKHGVQSSQNLSYREAVEDLAKALLLEPDNSVALSELASLSKIEEVELPLRVWALQIVDLGQYMKNLNEKAKYYQDRKERLYSDLTQSGLSGGLLDEGLRSMGNSSALANRPDEGKGPLETLPSIISELTLIKENLIQNVRILEKECRWLEYAGKNYQAQQGFLSAKTALPNGRTAIVDLENNADRSSSAMVDLSLQLAERDMRVNEIHLQYQELKNEFNDLQSRFELGQRIIREKDEKIKDYESERIGRLQQKSGAEQEKIAQLQATLREYQKDLNGALRQVDEKTQQYTSLQKQYDVLKQKKELEVQPYLNEISEIRGVLAFYQDILANATSEKKEQEAKLRQLEGRFAAVQEDLKKRQQVLEKSAENFVYLEKRVIGIEEKLYPRTMPLKISQPANPELDKGILELQTELNDIRSFIKNQLSDFEEKRSPFKDSGT